VYLFTSHEYYGRVASLMTTSVDGKRDVELPANVRAYAYMGGQHVPRVPVRRNPHDRYPTDPLDYTWSERALLLRLDAWVKDGTPPPQSRYPRIADSTLVAPEAVRFPRIAGVATPSPEVVHRAYRLDFGPSWPQGIESLQPPAVGTAYPVLVPQVDADGNDIGGLRLPEVAVPLGTYTGWNLRVPSDGFGSHLVDFYGSYLTFASTQTSRNASGDPRPSIAERYASRERYLAAFDTAARALARGGYLLEEDLPAQHARAETLWTTAHAPPAAAER